MNKFRESKVVFKTLEIILERLKNYQLEAFTTRKENHHTISVDKWIFVETVFDLSTTVKAAFVVKIQVCATPNTRRGYPAKITGQLHTVGVYQTPSKSATKVVSVLKNYRRYGYIFV